MKTLLAAVILPLLFLAPLDSKALPGDYEVHEWGLISGTASQAKASSSDLGHKVRRPVKTKKPVIYFHPGRTWKPGTPITATIDLLSGSLREVWPIRPTDPQPRPGAKFSWQIDNILRPEACSAIGPSLGSRACRSLGSGICEAHELRYYIKRPRNCLLVGDLRSPVLLYNGSMGAAKIPVEWVPKKTGSPVIRNTSDHPIGPIYLKRGGKILALGSLAPGASARRDDGKVVASSAKKFAKVLRAELKRQGLSSAEAADFLRAWGETIIQEPWAHLKGRRARSASGTSWSILGFYNPAAVERMMPLRLSPTPRKTVRVMAFALRSGRK